MDEANSGDGLFLRNYLGTVNAVTSCNNSTPAATGSSYFLRQSSGAPQFWKSKAFVGLENEFGGHGNGIIRDGFEMRRKWKTKENAEPDLRFGEVQNKIFNVSENDEEKGKKKEKKWSIGGLFKRKFKRDDDDSSDECEDEGRKGFLSRRKSNRDRRQVSARNTTGGFDVVIPRAKDQMNETSWGSAGEGCGRFIYRHRHPIAVDCGVSKLSKAGERVSSQSRGSGGGESFEVRKTRKGVLARAEAKRDLINDSESSSDDHDFYHSNSSVHKGAPEDRSGSRRRRVKRLPRDLGSGFYLSENKFRMAKSDLEGNRCPPPLDRFTLTPSHIDFTDGEVTSPGPMNHSTNPGSCGSLEDWQKELAGHYEREVGFYPMSTFPPTAHHFQTSGQLPSSRIRVPTKARNENPENLSHYRLVGVGTLENRSPRPCQKVVAAAAVGDLTVSSLSARHPSKFSMERLTEKSLSYDLNIHKSFHSSSNLPLEKSLLNLPQFDRPLLSHSSAGHRKRPQSPVQMDTNNGSTAHNCSNSAYENFMRTDACGNRVLLSRTDSLCTQPGISPRSPAHILNGNSFSHFGNGGSFRPHRSHSCHSLPVRVSPSYRLNAEGTSPQTLSIIPDNSVNERCLRRFGLMCDRASCCIQTQLECGTHPADEKTMGSVSTFPSINEAPSALRYYADQNPRSRNPIHITCNPACSQEQSYLSDSQIMPKALKRVKGKIKNAPEFWKGKDLEIVLNCKNERENILDESKPNRRPPHESKNPSILEPEKEMSSAVHNAGITGCEWNGNDGTPPKPPVRRLSKSDVLERLHNCEAFKKPGETSEKVDSNSQKENLDEAFHELEGTKASLCSDCDGRNCRCPAAIPLFAERPAVSNKISDDMAYRRMNVKDRRDVKVFPAQSYLRSSPAPSSASGGNPSPRKEFPVDEPDITHDDMVFRNIRHANSTLRIPDPQPPFGIPIGVIAPAPNSDYLHATPKQRFRPTFKSSKTPDVVKDDLAFRNLRKDKQSKVVPLELKADGSNELKKRAVRETFYTEEYPNGKNCRNADKVQSLVNLTGEDSGERQTILTSKLKHLKKYINGKKAEFFLPFQSTNSKSDYEKMECSPNGMFIMDLDNGVTGTLENQNSWNSFTSSALTSPVVKLSKYPAAAPVALAPSNPFKEISTWTSSVDEEELDTLLSALASQAINTSNDLAKQLDELDSVKYLAAETSYSDAPASAMNDIWTVESELTKKKRRRNLSLPTGDKSAEDDEKIGTLGRIRMRKQIEGCQAEAAATPERPKESEDDAAAGSAAKSVNETASFESSTQSDDTSNSRSLPDSGFWPPHVLAEFSQIICDCKTEGLKDSSGEARREEMKVSPTNEVPKMGSGAVAATATATARAGVRSERENEDLPRTNGFHGRSDRREGEHRKGSFKNKLWLACAYALAFAFHLQEIDLMTALGLVLAVVSIVAILIL